MWDWASLFIIAFHSIHFAWSMYLTHYSTWKWMHAYQIEWKSIQASLVIILFLLIHSQTPHKNTQRMLHHQIEWKSMQSSLVIIFLLTDSLSNSTWEHQWNALSPNWMEVNAVKSSHHSPFNWFTLKLYIRTFMECITTKLNGSQCSKV